MSTDHRDAIPDLPLALASARVSIVQRAPSSGQLTWFPDAAALGNGAWTPATFAELGSALSPEDGRSLLEAVNAAAAAGDGARVRVEVAADQGRRAILILLSPVRGRDERAADLIGLVMDVTGERQGAVDTAERRAQEALRRFGRTVAHDLNNLLTLMVGFTRLVVDSFDDGDPRRDDLGQVLAACERAARLADDLMSGAKTSITFPR